MGWVMDFQDGSRELRELLGGKGAGVAEMTRVLGAERVPAGFTITTEACVAYMDGEGEFPRGPRGPDCTAIERLEAAAGKRLGDAEDPLLVSVRSGARESMPGMLDTVLNLGLNDDTVGGLAARSGNERFAWDSYRRFAQMFGNVVLGVSGDRFQQAIAGRRPARGVARHRARHRSVRELTRSSRASTRSPPTRASSSCRPFGRCSTPGRASARSPTGGSTAYPTAGARRSTCSRWCSATSGEQRQRRRLLARRADGRADPFRRFPANAQGEDVVSGVRTPRDIAELADWLPDVHAQLMEILRTLERHYGDMQDTEFTVQEGRLYMLQTRSAKRPAQAAVRFAVDAVEECLLDREAGPAHDRPGLAGRAAAPDLRPAAPTTR